MDRQGNGSWRVTSPLGGDVTQWMQTSWIRTLSQQTGFININNSSTGDAALEQRIVEDVAGYGRQLGRIMDALDLVIGRMGLEQRTDLTDDERHALDDFSRLVRQVQALKGGGPPRLTEADLDRTADDLRALRHKDPATYERMVERLREAVTER